MSSEKKKLEKLLKELKVYNVDIVKELEKIKRKTIKERNKKIKLIEEILRKNLYKMTAHEIYNKLKGTVLGIRKQDFYKIVRRVEGRKKRKVKAKKEKEKILVRRKKEREEVKEIKEVKEGKKVKKVKKKVSLSRAVNAKLYVKFFTVGISISEMEEVFESTYKFRRVLYDEGEKSKSCYIKIYTTLNEFCEQVFGNVYFKTNDCIQQFKTLFSNNNITVMQKVMSEELLQTAVLMKQIKSPTLVVYFIEAIGKCRWYAIIKRRYDTFKIKEL